MNAPTRAPRVPFALLVVALVVGGLLLLLALNTASAANELRRHDLATKDQRVAAQVQQLRNEVAASAAPGNLARAAIELGMVPAGYPAFIVLGADGSVKVLGKPKAVDGVPLVIAPAPTPTRTKPAKAKPTTAKPTPSKTSTKTGTKTGAKTGAKTSKTAATKTPNAARTTAKPTPTPTPTPTLTLPGGHR